MSQRSNVINEIMSRLESKIPNTFRDRDSVSEDDEFPLANAIIEETKSIQKVPNEHKYKIQLPISVEAITKEQTDDPFTEIENLLTDIKTAILTDQNLNGLCIDFSFKGESDASRQYGGSFIIVAANFLLTYTENYCNED